MAVAMATTGGIGHRPAATSNGGVSSPAEESEMLTSWPHEGHRLWAALPDAFWVYMYKVQRCPHQGNHDWTLCPYAHRGERARRRDPRRHAYMGVACPDYRASRGAGAAPPTCPRGFNCRYAHGVFELWLHPTRFRTRMCDAGAWCPRRICFFAHRAEQRRREDDVGPFLTRMAALTPLPPRPRAVEALASSPIRPPDDVVMQTSSSDGGSTTGSSSRLAEMDSDSGNDNLPDFHAILDMLERLVMD